MGRGYSAAEGSITNRKLAGPGKGIIPVGDRKVSPLGIIQN
jgi:hypothetical protein